MNPNFCWLGLFLLGACATAAEPGEQLERGTCDTDFDCGVTERCEAGMCVSTIEAGESNAVTDPTDSTDETAEDTSVPEEPVLQAAISSPASLSAVFSDENVVIAGSFSVSDGDLTHLTAEFSSSIDGPLASTFSTTTGVVSSNDRLSVGNHRLTLRVTRGDLSVEATVDVSICGPLMEEDFDVLLDDQEWRVYGDAMQTPSGWLEMTNNQAFHYGKIFNVAQKINPGNLSASFRIYTGPYESGADGFSLFIVNADNVDHLEKILACSGGIGPQFSINRENCDMEEAELFAQETFAVEFDTYANGIDCGTPQNAPVDPTCEDHVAVLVDGLATPFGWSHDDFGDEETPFWSALENFEDSQWHDVQVELHDTQVVVTFDGEVIIDAQSDEFGFKGGYLGFTGGSGAATNYHRFDDLSVRGVCQFQSP